MHDLHLDAAFIEPPPPTAAQVAARPFYGLARFPLKWLGLGCLFVALMFSLSGEGWDAAQAFAMGLGCVGARLGLERMAWPEGVQCVGGRGAQTENLDQRFWQHLLYEGSMRSHSMRKKLKNCLTG